MRNRHVQFMTTLAALSMLAACALTEKTSEWRDPAYSGGKIDHILVIGVSPQVTVRRLFETTLVERLKQRNINAVPSYDFMAVDEKVSEESVKNAIEGKGFDAVLITHLVGVDQKELYVTSTHQPIHHTYYGYYSDIYDRVYQPGFYQRYDLVKLETRLYDTNTEKMIWSMQSSTIDPNSEDLLIKSNIGAVIEALAKQGLI